MAGFHGTPPAKNRADWSRYVVRLRAAGQEPVLSHGTAPSRLTGCPSRYVMGIGPPPAWPAVHTYPLAPSTDSASSRSSSGVWGGREDTTPSRNATVGMTGST